MFPVRNHLQKDMIAEKLQPVPPPFGLGISGDMRKFGKKRDRSGDGKEIRCHFIEA